MQTLHTTDHTDHAEWVLFYTSFCIYFWLTLFSPKYTKQCLTDRIWILVTYHVDMGRTICPQEQWNNRRTKTSSGRVGKPFVPLFLGQLWAAQEIGDGFRSGHYRQHRSQCYKAIWAQCLISSTCIKQYF